MPDHVHVVLEGQDDASDFRRLVHDWKQTTGFAARHRLGYALWQRGFYEHVLRADEDVSATCLYVLENAVRAGLVRTIRDYPLLGSDTTTIDDLLLRGVNEMKDVGRV